MPGPQIHIEIDDSKLRQMIAETAGPIEPKIVADGVEYGIFQECGPSGESGRSWQFTPFMRPAVEAVRAGFVQAMGKALSAEKAQKVVDKAAFDVEHGAKQRVRVDTSALKNSIHVVSGDTFGVDFEKLSHGKRIE